jgi:D-amino-acid dehydrogenase
MKVDAIVLGAGMVGVGAAIHLAQRGRSVVLIDRRQPGEETSYGNAGLIQREGVLPHAFPQHLGKLLKYGLNNSADMHYQLSALPGLAPFLARYWWHSRPRHYERIVRLYAPLIAHSVSEHAALIEAAGAGALIEKRGWYLLFRSEAARDEAFAEADWIEAEFGVHHLRLDADAMLAEEPALLQRPSGALHWTDPWTIRDPKALTTAYADLFGRLGGVFRIGDATRLSPDAAGWQIETEDGRIEARDAVIALGPWADLVTRRLGYRLPLAVKRGYHMHYRPVEGRELRNWVLDAESGYLLAPMNQGIRLTTGAEFAGRDSPPTPVQLERTEPVARRLFPLGERIDPGPWMGARPCTPDMMPIIGPAPRHKGLWFAFGHAHHGMTLGPATGRLIADLVVGAPPFIAPQAFSAARFAA